MPQNMDTTENRNRKHAKRLMLHYLTLIADRAGVNLDFDCLAEISWMVDSMIDAAKEEMRAELEEAQR